MIFKQFDPNQDVVAGRTTRVASGFWPGDSTAWSQSFFVDDFWSLTGSSTPSPSFGTSVYDVRHTMYYLNVFPDSTHLPSDPYFSIAYGHIAGNVGSGSFGTETQSIQASPTKTVYTQYKNMLLGTSDPDGQFTMNSGSTTLNAQDIWVVDFSAYKMKDKIDEGLLQLSFSGSNGQFTFIDDSIFSTQTLAVYQLITGSVSNPPATPGYEGIGLFYPSNGVVVLNATSLANKVGISYPLGVAKNTNGPGTDQSWPYNSGSTPDSQYSITSFQGFTYNHKTLASSMEVCTAPANTRKSEYVSSRHYFVRVLNKDFNYSNNPTYVYDGTDGIHPKGMIRNADFITDPKTYITTIGLYNDSNELVAVAKTSRPYVKSFDSELGVRVRLDF